LHTGLLGSFGFEESLEWALPLMMSCLVPILTLADQKIDASCFVWLIASDP
jgi:hypothetical protein